MQALVLSSKLQNWALNELHRWLIFHREGLIADPETQYLSSWVPNRPVKPIRESDYLVSDYALMSGTSISCPHVAGIVALLKAMQRDWSSAAIRSAMINNNLGTHFLQ